MSPVSSSTYWIPPTARRISAVNSSTGASSSYSSDASSTPRHYVDPWDLENYAYLRRRCEDSDPVVSLSTNGLDSAQSDFYFIPARQPLAPLPQPLPQPQRAVLLRGPRRPSVVVVEDPALVEEEDFYNARMACCHHHPRRHSIAPAPAQDQLVSFQPDMYEKSKVSSKEPPPLVYVYQTPRLNRKASRQYREYLQPISTSSEDADERELRTMIRRRSRAVPVTLPQLQPGRFGLSSFGHLQIDYSCNWSNLDRYIAQ